MKPSRKRYYFEHTKQRLQERYRLNLTRTLLVYFKRQVLAKKSKRIWQRGHRTCEQVLAGQKFVYLVYDHAKQQVVTVLPASDPKIRFFQENEDRTISKSR